MVVVEYPMQKHVPYIVSKDDTCHILSENATGMSLVDISIVNFMQQNSTGTCHLSPVIVACRLVDL